MFPHQDLRFSVSAWKKDEDNQDYGFTTRHPTVLGEGAFLRGLREPRIVIVSES